jgi:Polysaccharide lyase
MSKWGNAVLAGFLLLVPFGASAESGSCGTRPFKECGDLNYESGKLSAWNTKRVLHPYSARVVAVSTLPNGGQVPSSKYVARFELRHGDSVSGGFRSEVKERYNAEHGATIRYGFALMIPSDYPIAEDHKDQDGHMLGCMFGQWHDEPNPGTQLSREPLFENYYINGDLQIYVKSLMAPWEYKTPQLFAAAVGRANDPFDKGDLEGEIKGFAKGTWHLMQYEVKWLQDPGGYLKAWVDGKQLVDYRGPIGYADEWGSYFKYGVYCKYDVTAPHIAYLGPYLRQLVP